MPLGGTRTLLSVRTAVRMATKTESVQQSGLLEPTLTNYIHEAVCLVRALARHSLKEFYRQEAAVTLAASVDISAMNVFDIATMRLVAPDGKSVDILPRNLYNQMIQLHTFPTGEWIATVTTKADNTFSLLVGGAAAPTGSATLAYERNPTKVTTDASVLDIPDHLAPIVTDFTALAVWRKLKQQPDAEVSQRISAFIKEQVADEKLAVEKR